MTGLAQWVNDLRWAMNVMRARRARRNYIFAKRRAFDDALRPRIQSARLVVTYPDAFYGITIDDVCRAVTAAGLPEKPK